MRIISQGKEFDLPYKETTLQAFSNGTVIAFSLTDLVSDNFITMAKYSTEEKAIKAMEMCREKYLSFPHLFQQAIHYQFTLDLGCCPLVAEFTVWILVYPCIFDRPFRFRKMLTVHKHHSVSVLHAEIVTLCAFRKSSARLESESHKLTCLYYWF